MMNQEIKFDGEWVQGSKVNAWGVYDSVNDISKEKCKLNGVYRAAWLLRAVSCIDLTTLTGDETRCNVVRLCQKALKPLKPSLLNRLGFSNTVRFTTAAVCLYPARVGEAASIISCKDPVKIAAVATGFPSGQFGIESRLKEIDYAINKGAEEIDVVIDRSLVLTGKWYKLYEELKLMKIHCRGKTMKTILSTGELLTFENVYRASLVAMMAGSDFIKTSTGKESVNATLTSGLVMLRAIRDYQDRTGKKVGFKPAGGIKTADDALDWLILVKREMGNDWLGNNLLRIGASSLLNDIESDLESLAENLYS